MSKQALTDLLAMVEAGNEPEWDDVNPVIPYQWGNVVKAYHGSLDAALALHDAVLPGWDWRAEENVNGYVAHIGPAREEFMPSIMAVSFEGAARAWLCAILKALIAEAGE